MSTKKRKVADENRRLNKQWPEKYADIESDGNPLCLICSVKLQKNKSSNVERHFEGKHKEFAQNYLEGECRKKAINELQRKQLIQQNCFSNYIHSGSTTTEASFALSFQIAKAGKPFTNDLILSKIKDIPLSARTVKERILNIAEEVSNMKIENIKRLNFCPWLLIMMAVVMVKYLTASGVQEKLLELLPMKGQMRGEDIAESVLKCLETKNINIERIVSVATDRAPAMIAKSKGFIKLFSSHISHKIISFHCILHQEALVAKSLRAIPQLKNAMEVIVPIVNFIRAKSLNHKIFTALLEELDFIHKELVTFTAVRWLSRGKTFSECLSEITKFLAVRNYNEEHCKLLKNSEWLQKFYFLLDMTERFKKLNLEMQGKRIISAQLLEELSTFEQKLDLFLDDISGDQFIYFNSLRNFRMKIISEAEKVNRKQFFEIITTIVHQFASRFHDFRKYQETLKFVMLPLKCNLTLMDFNAFPEINIADLHLELVEIRNKSIWADKFEAMLAHIAIYEENMKDTPQDIIISGIYIFRCWTSLPNTYINSKTLAFGLLSIFSSTYNCEQFFSSMNFIKNKYQSRLTDESTQALLQLHSTKYRLNLTKLSKKVQIQKSH
ncbi:general transcription factor II-I repeat domain-containing protein 2B-like [Hydra vulgaris]|uniref:General transcription factor II-I repeat domain-containing protein 2B-like n=1 Tax=Hydra vulgaris TaxID=6087 RepID=A0ABM4CS83_HYDVU